MKITVPTTFEDIFVDGLREINNNSSDNSPKIREVYGSLQTSILASARPSKYLPAPGLKKIRKHIENLKYAGIDFSYLVNAPCIGNIEYTYEGRKEIEDLFAVLSDLGVSRMVITIPYLMEIVREKFPHIEICASSICYISSVKIAKRFESIGVKRIIIDPDRNRDFKLIRKISDAVDCEVEIIANHTCIHHCSYEYYHYNNTGHGSQSTEFQKEKPYNQYSLLSCTLKKLESPWEFLASPWIPPAETGIFDNTGVTWLKLAGRGSSSETLLTLADAYVNKRHSKDLISLLGWRHWDNFRKTPDNTNLPIMKILLDSEKLKGFMEKFTQSYDCDDGCGSCSHCKEYADKSMSFDIELLKSYRENLAQKLSSIVEENKKKSSRKTEAHVKVLP